MQERTNQELDVAAMVMLLDCGMSLKDIAECFKLEAKTVERLIVEYLRSPASRPRQRDPELYTGRHSSLRSSHGQDQPRQNVVHLQNE